MPTISESNKGGLKIAINYCDHNPPHFHVIKARNPSGSNGPLIERSGRKMIHEICMVMPAKGRKVDCYFTSGHVRRFDMASLLKPDCAPVFRPLRNRKTFLSTMTVINGTLAFDVAGNRNEYKCVDIDPETVFQEGKPIVSNQTISN